MRAVTSLTLVIGIALIAALGITARSAQAQDGAALVNARCSACHEARANGTHVRINDVRKTPEAWDMTIVRMMNIHGVKVTPVERRALVKYLADTQGLAPSESANYRYILERTPGLMDTGPDELLTQMCARCHSFARVALQRRDKEDWLKLMNFHLGQYPTAEYQALGRDRDWWKIATTKVVDELAKRLPYKSDAWTAWKNHKAPDLSGTWRFAGHQPGRGDYDGMLTIKAKGNDRYSVATALTFTNGAKVSRSGSAILYTGHEWRASTRGADGRAHQVMQASEDGKSMSGRWFYRDVDVIGGTIKAVRVAGAAAQVLSVSPGYVKAGGSARVTIAGVGLSGNVGAGDGVTVKVESRSPTRIVAMVSAAGGASAGARDVTVGGAKLAGALVVYDKVAAVKVMPEQTFARVGGAGGPIAPAPAQFEAVAYAAGPDGKAGTKDDIRIGVMSAKWSVADFDAVAKAMKDTEFAGKITQTGLFHPAGAGPNPKRPKSTNNAGNLSVIAAVTEGGKTVTGKAHLFVTVQRFIDPPIR
jgi:quinohemoprotein amine dehydrogenase